MLYLISIGLCDENDLSLKGLETAKSCDKLYAEFYTTKLDADCVKLSKIIGKAVIELKRADLEEDSKKLIEEAKTKNIGILVGGDALSATTHLSILLDAKKAGVKTMIIHSSSMYTAVAETGLMLYKFGATTTLVFPEKNYSPTSCYDTILKNKNMGLHTLVLLDIKPPRYMNIKEGLEILLEMENEKGGKLFSESVFLVVASNFGSEKQKIKYGKISSLLKEDFGTPAVIIVPGELHFFEKEYLESLG